MDQKRHTREVISAGEGDRQAAKSIALIIHLQYRKGKLKFILMCTVNVMESGLEEYMKPL